MKVIDEPDKNRIMISVFGKEFVDIMGYCEFKIQNYLAGYKVPIIGRIKDGIEAHKKDEEFEKEHMEFVPITNDEWSDLSKDLEFPYESLLTRYLDLFEIDNKKIYVLIRSQTDKLGRRKGNKIIRDTKYPEEPLKYQNKLTPWETDKLQVLLYLNSKYVIRSVKESLKPDNWFDIPHRDKEWFIVIKDKKKDKVVRVYSGKQKENDKIYLKNKIRRFVDLTLGRTKPNHHNSMNKCRRCKLECDFRLS